MLLGNLPGNQADTVAHMKRRFAWFQLIFGVIFTLAALAFGILGVIRPALQMRAASRWVQTPCVITQSSVVRRMVPSSTRGRPSQPGYSLELAYQYQFGDKSYRGTTYSFDAVDLKGFEETSKFAAQFPTGTSTVCWTNPAQPEQSVLKRDAQQPRLLLLVPVVLLVAGIAISFNALKTLRA